jgi:predicted membrane-bound spermidine synthase
MLLRQLLSTHESAPRSVRPGAAPLPLVFFLSGAAALIFETLWFRLAGLTFGSSMRAASLVLTSFMAGLALGNVLAARRGDRVRRPLRIYALIEALIGISGLALVLVLPALTGLLAPLFRALASVTWLLDASRFAIAGLLLLVPTSAMGATLPLVMRASAADAAGFGRELGRLYGWNTLGAVAGALLGEMLLIRTLGLRGTGAAAAMLSFAAALLALRAGGPRLAVAPERSTSSAGRATLVLLAAALGGAVLLSLEVVWFRLLLLYVHGTSLAFAVMLAVVLSGISAGGFAASLWLRRTAAEHGVMLLALAAGGCVVVSYAGFDAVSLFGNRLIHEPEKVAVLSLILMFPGSLLSGALFTLLGAALNRRVGGAARSSGWLTLSNTFGAALGALAGGLVLLPGIGVEASFFTLAVAYGLLGALCAWFERPKRGRELAAALLYAGVLAVFPFGLMQGRHLHAIRERFGYPAMQLEAVREGVSETVVYLRRDLWGAAHHHQLVTNGLSMSGSPLSAKRYMKQYVYWPLALRPQTRRALLICYGVGSTAKALTDTRSLTAIDVVDVSAEILELARVAYPRPATNPLEDPRVRRHVEDGRFFLETAAERYDLITGEPPPPKSAGVGNLYSREYFALMRERLAPHGVVTYWLPVDQLEGAETRAIIRAFCDVFDECSLWTGVSTAWMLAGSRGRLPPVTEHAFAAQWRDPAVAAELRAVGFDTPELLGATFLADAEFLERLVADDSPLLDDAPLRLSPTPPARPDPLYAELMDVDGARQRYAASAFIRRVWPEALRERTLRAFEVQRLVNRRFSPSAVLPMYAEVAPLLVGPQRLPALTLWLLDSDRDELRLAQAARGRGIEDGFLEFKLGVAALFAREPVAAERHFARALATHPREGVLLARYRALALCLAGRPEEAAAVTADRAMREWLQRSCAIYSSAGPAPDAAAFSPRGAAPSTNAVASRTNSNASAT